MIQNPFIFNLKNYVLNVFSTEEEIQKLLHARYIYHYIYNRLVQATDA